MLTYIGIFHVYPEVTRKFQHESTIRNIKLYCAVLFLINIFQMSFFSETIILNVYPVEIIRLNKFSEFYARRDC